MARVDIGIAYLKDPLPDDIKVVKGIFEAIAIPDLPWLTMLGQPHWIEFVDTLPETSYGFVPEGLYVSAGRVQVRRRWHIVDGVKVRRIQAEIETGLHELCHGLILSKDQKQALIALFDAEEWRGDDYWLRVNESTCDACVRWFTGGKLVSNYEKRRRRLAPGEEALFLSIVTRAGTDGFDPDDGDPIADPPESDAAELMQQIAALEAEIKLRDQVITGLHAETEDLTIRLGSALDERDMSKASRQRLLIAGSVIIQQAAKLDTSINEARATWAQELANFNAKLGEESPA